MSNEPRAQTGISAYDVRNYARGVEREFGCQINYIVSLPLRKEARHALDFQCNAVGTELGTGRRLWASGVSRVWPTGECRTLTGLMFRLLHDLEIKLEEERTERQRLTQSRF